MENQIKNIILRKYNILPEEYTKIVMSKILKHIISKKKHKSHLFYKYQDFLLFNSPNEYLTKSYNLYQSIKYLLKITESVKKKIFPFLLNRSLNKLITQKCIIVKQIKLVNKRGKYFSHPASTKNIINFGKNLVQLKNNNSYINEKTIDLDEKDFIQNGCLDFATGNEICSLLKNFNKFDDFNNNTPCMIYTKKKSPKMSFHRAFSSVLNNINIINQKDYSEKNEMEQKKNENNNSNNKTPDKDDNNKEQKLCKTNTNRSTLIKKFYENSQNEFKINDRLTFTRMKKSLSTAKFIYRKKYFFSKSKDLLQQQKEFKENQSADITIKTKENEFILNNIGVKKIEINLMNNYQEELPLSSIKINNLKIPRKSKSIKKFNHLKKKASINSNLNNNMNINIINNKHQNKIKLNSLEYSSEVRKSDLGIFQKYANNYGNFILNLAKKKNQKKSKKLTKNKSNKNINFSSTYSLNISKKNNTNLINSKNYRNILKKNFSKLEKKSKIVNEKQKIINTKKLLNQNQSKAIPKSKNTEIKGGDFQTYRFNSPISQRDFGFFSSCTSPKSFNFKNRKSNMSMKNLNLLSFYNSLYGYNNKKYDMDTNSFKDQKTCFKFKRNNNYLTKNHIQKSNTDLVDKNEEETFFIENNNNCNSLKNNIKNESKKLIPDQNFLKSIIESPKNKERLSCEIYSTAQKKYNIKINNNKSCKYSSEDFSNEICDKIGSCKNMYIYNYTTNIYKNDYNTVSNRKIEKNLIRNKSAAGINLSQKEIKINQNKKIIKVNLNKNNNLNYLCWSGRFKDNHDNFMTAKHKLNNDVSSNSMKSSLVSPKNKKK